METLFCKTPAGQLIPVDAPPPSNKKTAQLSQDRSKKKTNSVLLVFCLGKFLFHLFLNLEVELLVGFERFLGTIAPLGELATIVAEPATTLEQFQIPALDRGVSRQKTFPRYT